MLMKNQRNEKVGDEIAEFDNRIREVETKLRDAALMLPNMCDASVPVGADEDENVEQRKWGEPRQFNFDVQAHWDLGESLDILDFNRAGKMSGARFTVYKGLGASFGTRSYQLHGGSSCRQTWLY